MADIKTKVLIVDDQSLLRDGLAALLSQVQDIEVVGSVSNAEEALKMFPLSGPDVVIMNMVLVGMTGTDATRWLKEEYPHVKVIFISSEISKDFVTAGIRCGIDGYLSKDIPISMLIDAIRTVTNGRRYFDRAIANLVFEDFYQRNKMKGVQGKIALPHGLTKREHEVLVLIASGKSNRAIADELFISIKTVETHKSHILVKLGLRNTAELVQYAIKNNIINLE